MTEIWRPVPSWPDHEASNLGRIRSRDRVIRKLNKWGFESDFRWKGRIMTPIRTLASNGSTYWVVTVRKQYHQRINRLVCEAFHGPAPADKPHAAHLDGNSENNRPENLQWCSVAENAEHRRGHGTMLLGEMFPQAKFTSATIPHVFSRFVAGERAKEIAAEFGTTVTTVHKVLRRERWRHVHVEERLVSAARELMRQRLPQNFAKARAA